MAILELEDGRKKALQELVTYKATAKNLDNDIDKYKAKATEWERRAMIAVRAGYDEAAKTALREKKSAETELAKITNDKHEAASYAIQLNRSRKEFETKPADAEAAQGHARDADRRGPLGGRRCVRQRLVGVGSLQGRRGSESMPRRSRPRSTAAMRGEEVDALEFDRKLAAAAPAGVDRRPRRPGRRARQAQGKDGFRQGREAEGARGREAGRRQEMTVIEPGDEALSARLREPRARRSRCDARRQSRQRARRRVRRGCRRCARAGARADHPAAHQPSVAPTRFNVLDASARMRGSDGGAWRVSSGLAPRLTAQADAARALAR